ncbi:putative secreted protein [Psilocybe cubensis]|uniref:Secreted protein n=1 Tax=Psilocybe cubensis TaxID=181762 RepID=A0ACB8GJ24_PSICU|nr:putative secreted protein [Psilocybe cubensis]KAH9475455.1 putative secreted protein [Psilocybe cubensis]
MAQNGKQLLRVDLEERKILNKGQSDITPTITRLSPPNKQGPKQALIKHCTTAVLKRDGTNVVVGSNCAATSGSWVSPYDNVPTNLASDLDIDHVVPLKEAWVSGARTWTNAQREAFANDLVRPQLIAVTDSLNQAKDPAEWMVPLASYRCTYVRAWIHVKYHYKLSVDQAEKTALTNYINAC